MGDGQISAGLISVHNIRFHPANVGRDLGDLRDLTESVKARGVLVPVILERHNGGLRLRDGHRRVTAARLAKVAKVPAWIHGYALEETDWLLASVDANTLQKGLDRDDQERIARRLVELGVSRAAVAKAFKISRAKTDELLDGPKEKPATTAPRRPPAMVSVKTLREVSAELENRGYPTDVQQLLAALAEGRPWHHTLRAAVTA